jgi:hypothetical protein
MNARVEKIKKLVSTYRSIQRDYPHAVMLNQLKRTIFSEIMEDAQAFDHLQINFLRRLQLLMTNKGTIEKAITDRKSIPHFTHLEDYNLKTLVYDKKRVNTLIRDYLKLKPRHAREAIINEALLFNANFLGVMRPFSLKLTELVGQYPDDDNIQYLLEMKFNQTTQECSVKALESVCKKGVKMELEYPLSGYQFKKDFVEALSARIVPEKQLAVPAPLTQSFFQRHRALYYYLISMSTIFGLTSLLVGLCFVPIVGPLLSTSLGNMLGGLSVALGLETTVEALTTSIALGLSVTLPAAAAVLTSSFFGAVNAALLTLLTGFGKFISLLRRDNTPTKPVNQKPDNTQGTTAASFKPLLTIKTGIHPKPITHHNQAPTNAPPKPFKFALQTQAHTRTQSTSSAPSLRHL